MHAFVIFMGHSKVKRLNGYLWLSTYQNQIQYFLEDSTLYVPVHMYVCVHVRLCVHILWRTGNVCSEESNILQSASLDISFEVNVLNV